MNPANGRARVEGPAFTPLVKLMASVLVAGLVAYGLRAAGRFAEAGVGGSLGLFLLLLTAMAVYCLWWILLSRTSVDATHLRQTWWRRKEVALAEITQTKLILVPGLTWLIGPRIVVRTRQAGSVVFHAAQRDVIAAFARISLGMPPLDDEAPPQRP